MQRPPVGVPMRRPSIRSIVRVLILLAFGIAQVLLAVRFAFLISVVPPPSAIELSYLQLTQPILDLAFLNQPEPGNYISTYHAYIALWDSWSGAIFDIDTLIALVTLTIVEVIALWAMGLDLGTHEPLPPLPPDPFLEREQIDWYAAQRAWARSLRARYGIEPQPGENVFAERSPS